jgi:hypothetical protein
MKLPLKCLVYNDIIQAHLAGFVSKALQDGYCQLLNCWRSIAEGKGRDIELPQPLTNGECCVILFAGTKDNLSVS